MNRKVSLLILILLLGFAASQYWWKIGTTRELFEGVFYLVAIIAAVYSVLQYRENSKHEKAKWLFQLYRRFYGSKSLQEMFDRIDWEKTDFVKEFLRDQEELFRPDMQRLDKLLNFFQFVAILYARGELGKDEILNMFKYPLRTLAEDEAVAEYISRSEYGYKELNELLNKLGYTSQHGFEER